MLQQTQIVKASGKQIDNEDPAYTKRDITKSHYVVWNFISVNVTIYRIVLLQRYQTSSNFIMMTTKLRSSV
jgi:hypothetical protein